MCAKISRQSLNTKTKNVKIEVRFRSLGQKKPNIRFIMNNF